MSEEKILKLLSYVRSHSSDYVAVQAKLQECARAIEWAKQAQRWDLVVEFTDALAAHFVDPSPVDANRRGDPESELEMKRFWSQGKSFVAEGLQAAELKGSQDKVIVFLRDLARLSGYLSDFGTAIDFLKRQASLVQPDSKWHVARELHMLGNLANKSGNFSAARTCYQASLSILQEIDSKLAMAEELQFMAANETMRIERDAEAVGQFSDGLRSAIEALWELSGALRQEAQSMPAEPPNESASLTAGDSTYRRLQNTLAQLNSFT
jgi:hypothetical protein